VKRRLTTWAAPQGRRGAHHRILSFNTPRPGAGGAAIPPARVRPPRAGTMGQGGVARKFVGRVPQTPARLRGGRLFRRSHTHQLAHARTQPFPVHDAFRREHTDPARAAALATPGRQERTTRKTLPRDAMARSPASAGSTSSPCRLSPYFRPSARLARVGGLAGPPSSGGGGAATAHSLGPPFEVAVDTHPGAVGHPRLMWTDQRHTRGSGTRVH